MIDFEKLTGLKKTQKVGLRGEWTDKVVTPAEKDGEGKVVKAAVTQRVFTGMLVEVRALLPVESLAVQNAFDRPEVPMRKDSNKGSNAPSIPHYDEPGFVRAEREHADKVAAAWAAVAIDCEHEGKTFNVDASPAEHRVWLNAVVAKLRGRGGLLDGEIAGIVGASRSLAAIGSAVDEALKN